jgi:hypothetical protein
MGNFLWVVWKFSRALNFCHLHPHSSVGQAGLVNISGGFYFSTCVGVVSLGMDEITPRLAIEL